MRGSNCYSGFICSSKERHLISYNKRKHTDNFMNTSDNHILVYLDKSPFTIEIATKCVHLLNITRQGTQNQKENRRIFHHFMKKLV